MYRCVMGLVHQQPRTNDKSKGNSANHDEDERAKKAKEKNNMESRKRAKKFAKTLPNGKGPGKGKGISGDDNASDSMDTSDDEEPTPTPAEPSPSPAASRSRAAPSPNPAVQPSRSNQGMGTIPAVVQLPAVPPMHMAPMATPPPTRRKRSTGTSTHEPLPNGSINGNSNDSGSSTPSLGMAGRRTSFLEHAKTNNSNVNTPAATATNEDATPVRPRHQNGSGWSTFVSRYLLRVTPSAADADTAANDTVISNTTTPAAAAAAVGVGRQKESAAPHAHAHEQVARVQGRARIWASNW